VVCDHYLQTTQAPFVGGSVICLNTGCGTIVGLATALLFHEMTPPITYEYVVHPIDYLSPRRGRILFSELPSQRGIPVWPSHDCGFCGTRLYRKYNANRGSRAPRCLADDGYPEVIPGQKSGCGISRWAWLSPRAVYLDHRILAQNHLFVTSELSRFPPRQIRHLRATLNQGFWADHGAAQS
jgi:hypothetical protein